MIGVADRRETVHRGSDASTPRPHIVVVGGGFGGLSAARALKRAPVRVTLIDRANHHLFQPLLYQVATAGLPAPQIAAPIRQLLRRQANCRVLMGEVERIDRSSRTVHFGGGSLAYDHLIVAAGASHAYFGQDHWQPHAPGLKTLDDALLIRRRILAAFERAERESDPARRAAALTFVVVGAGATGVELAGTLAEIARHTLPAEFRDSDPRCARVLLLEGSDRVLPPFAPDLSRKAELQLRCLGVEVRCNARVTDIDAEGVRLNHERIAADTVLWAAGVAASPVGATLGAAVDRTGRVQVQLDLTLPGDPRVQVVGDLAAIMQAGAPVPGVADAAEQAGRHAARNIVAQLSGGSTRPFRYRHIASVATIGRNKAVADLGGLRLWGRPAWWFWLLIHVLFLIGFRNRLVVMVDWAWSYFTFDRHARLILGKDAQGR
jgi:NADH dehydrogenase